MCVCLNLDGKVSWVIERLARVDNISGHSVEKDLIIDVGMKSIGENLAKVELMSISILAYVMEGKESSWVPENGTSGVGKASGTKAILAEIASLIELILN